MAKVTIYTKAFCPFCARAMKLLREKGVAFEEIEAGFDAGKTAEMVQRAGGQRTYPQIFINDAHIGGCDALLALDAKGELDPLLA